MLYAALLLLMPLGMNELLNFEGQELKPRSYDYFDSIQRCQEETLKINPKCGCTTDQVTALQANVECLLSNGVRPQKYSERGNVN